MTELRSEPASVLIVDDHEGARSWLSTAVLAAFPRALVHQAATARDAISAIVDIQPDLVLLDLGLPDASGLEVLRLLRSRRPECVCVVATVFDDDEHLFSALRLGADGYLLKDQARDSLTQSLAGILKGEPALSAGIARRLMGHFSKPAESTPRPLTDRERDVLQLVGKGCSVPETARLLGISAHTAHGYVRDLYRKLAVSSRAEAAVVASRLGLV